MGKHICEMCVNSLDQDRNNDFCVNCDLNDSVFCEFEDKRIKQLEDESKTFRGAIKFLKKENDDLKQKNACDKCKHFIDDTYQYHCIGCKRYCADLFELKQPQDFETVQ